jgi:glycosyltransferase involved in cell wall biosynthesis
LSIVGNEGCMRIALVTEVFLPAVDGVVTRLCHTLAALREAGDEVLVVAPGGGPARYAGARVIAAPALPMPLYPDGNGYPAKRVSVPTPTLGRTLREFAPELIHAVNPFLLAAGGVYHARRMRVPLIASYHANVPAYAAYYRMGALEGAGWRYVRALHNQAALNLCTSLATMSLLRERRVRRLALWPYGIEERFRRERPPSPEWRARLSGGRPERPILLFVGRLAREKSVERLAPAIRALPQAALAIVGDGPLRPALEREFAGTETSFLGLLDGEELACAYASADVFLFPSQSETLGLVMLEARAAGLPVIAAESPAARELLHDGFDGLLYDPAAPHALAAAVRRLICDRRLCERMGARARRAVRGASWSEATGVLRAHYARVLASPQAQSADRLALGDAS